MKPIQAKTYSTEVADAVWKIDHANTLVEYIKKDNGKYHQYASREVSTYFYNRMYGAISNEVRRHVLPLRIFTDRTMSRR